MPDTTGPYYAAYLITAVVLIGYAFSIWRRAKTASEKLAERSANPQRRS